MSKVTMPEPVAWSVFDKRSGKHWYTHESSYTAQGYADHYAHNDADGPSQVVRPLITTTQAEAYAQAVRREALLPLIQGYVNLLESGRDRIISLGGDCDPVDVMEARDPYLRAARAALAQEQGGSDDPTE